MASPTFKTLPTVVQEAIDYVVANSELNDAIPGSVIRTIIEAASIQDAEQYVQMLRVLDVFSIDTSEGDDLDRRVDDFGFTRLASAQATGNIVVTDTSIVAEHKTTLLGLHGIGSPTITVAAGGGAGFPVAGTLILERGVIGQVEYRAYTLRVGDVFTLTLPTTKAHAGGSSVILSQQGTDQLIATGTVAFIPETAISQQINYETTADGFVLDGDKTSAPIPIIAQKVGEAGNAAATAINTFVVPPFGTATVSNPTRCISGRDRETDKELVDRVKAAIASLSNATAVAIETASIGVISGTDEVTTAKVVDDIVTPGQVTLYISDADGITVTTSLILDEVTIFNANAGQKRGRLKFFPGVPGTLRLYKVGVPPFGDKGTSSAVGLNFLTDASKGWVVNQWALFILVDSAGVFFTVTSNTANTLTIAGTPAPGNYAIMPTRVTAPLVEGVDYTLNRTVMEFELTVALATNDRVVAMSGVAGVPVGYSYYTGLIREVQRVISGDISDLTTYPGVAAAGIRVFVTAPVIVNQSFVVAIDSDLGVSESSLIEAVRTVIVNYVNSLNIGGDIILSEIVFAIQSITGIFDVKIITPSDNVVIADNQVARTTLADIAVS